MKRSTIACRTFHWRVIVTVFLVPGPRGRAQEGLSPTFARDVAPLVFESCLPCHHEGGSAPFVLREYRDVAKRGRMILDLLERRLMPPWLPAPGIPLHGDRRLPDDRIEMFRSWVAHGMPLGDPQALPATPTYASGFRHGEPDLILQPDVAFLLPAGGPEVFRNFVIPIPIARVLFVRALEIDPGPGQALHHALLQVDTRGTARRLAALDPLPGFPGMEMGDSEPPDGHMIGWTPGKGPRVTPADMAFRLRPRTDFVLQVHLRPTGRPESVRPRIGLWFTDRAPTRFPRVIELFDDRIDLPPGVRDQRVVDRVTLPAACHVLSIYPHAHYLATSLRAEAVRPDGTRLTLFDIPRWDFDWQDEYTYTEPVALEAGTRITFDYRFDNTRENPANPSDPPVRVQFGNRSVDEMATLTMEVLPLDAAGDLAFRRLLHEHRLEKHPFDAHALNHLGILAAEEGRLDEAARTFRRALRFDPREPDLHGNLGRVLMGLGQADAARRALDRALELDPEHADALVNRAELAQRAGRHDEVIVDLERALASQETHVRAWVMLGMARARRSEPRLARAAFLRVLDLEPGQPEALHNLATTYLAEGEFEAACRYYRAALVARPDYANARLNLARALLGAGRRDEAREELRVLLASHPTLDAARTLLDAIGKEP